MQILCMEKIRNQFHLYAWRKSETNSHIDESINLYLSIEPKQGHTNSKLLIMDGPRNNQFIIVIRLKAVSITRRLSLHYWNGNVQLV